MPHVPGIRPAGVYFVIPTGTTQATAAQIIANVSPGMVVAAGNAVGGVVLPAASKGKLVFLFSTGTDLLHTLYVYPFSTNQINALGASNPLVMLPQTAAIFMAQGSTTWLTVPNTPS
jgi:hypothetical protein